MSNIVSIQNAMEQQLEQLAKTLGESSVTERAKLYARSVLNEITRTQGNEFGDLTKCSPESIVQSMLDGARFGVMIDGRKLAHLESRYNKDRKCNEATLQIDTNGFVAKISEVYPDVSFTDVAVFDGDVFQVSDVDGVSDYKYISKNPFQSVDKLLGVAVKIRYTDNGKTHQSIELVSKSDLAAMQSKAKGNAWRDFPLERMKTAALKRACKWHFRKITGLKEIIEFDNTNNYDFENVIEHQAEGLSSISSDLTAEIKERTGGMTQEEKKRLYQEADEALDVVSDESDLKSWSDQYHTKLSRCIAKARMDKLNTKYNAIQTHLETKQLEGKIA